MRKLTVLIVCIVASAVGQVFASGGLGSEIQSSGCILDFKKLDSYVEVFNQLDDELYVQSISNAKALAFLRKNIPLFECPDKQLEETYYFRWWVYRKHVKSTPDGFVVSEFLPDVPWAGKHNTISCAAGHHFYEGRWLHDPQILSDYARFWFGGGGNPRLYSFWAVDAIYRFYLVHPDRALIEALYPPLKDNFQKWEKEKCDETGLFWQIDDRDGMEASLSGRLSPDHAGYRPTINAYMYGDALALSKIAGILKIDQDAGYFSGKADKIKKLINERLWDDKSRFFKVIPKIGRNEFSDVRELHGYTPWYFDIPPKEYADAWLQLMDTKGFFAPYGPTTAEQRHPEFKINYSGHECQWNGPSWPYATSITLTGLANLLNTDSSAPISKADYMTLLKQYANAHKLTRRDGNVVPWIDENLNPFTGDWVSRTRLKTWKNGTWDADKGGKERGKDYNHSTFCDLIISGLVGVHPQDDGSLFVVPLVPDNWNYFCLQDVRYRGKNVTIFYDRDGSRYKKGKGFFVLIDGKAAYHSSCLQKTELKAKCFD